MGKQCRFPNTLIYKAIDVLVIIIRRWLKKLKDETGKASIVARINANITSRYKIYGLSENERWKKIRSMIMDWS
jgi:hypothetical protein